MEYAPGCNTLVRDYMHGNFYNPDYEYIEKLGQMVRKYMHFNKTTQEFLDKFIKENDINDMTLAVHMRGTDFKKGFKNHPIYVEPEEYYPFIDEAIKKHNLNKIFIATDDINILNDFLNHYSDMTVVYSKNTFRSDSNMGSHTITKKNDGLSQYNEVMNLLCDVIGLSRCGAFVSGVSNVSMFARVYRRSYERTFIYDKIIDKGIKH